ncbi:MAG: ATP-dependent DNA helicase RecG [Syntrophales bacterium]
MPDQLRDTAVKTGDVDACFRQLSRPVQVIKGVGPKTAAILGKKGIQTVRDILYFLPRKYEDRRTVRSISEARIGRRETILARIAGTEVKWYGRKKIFEAILQDASGRMTAKWFRGGEIFLRRSLRKGARIILSGEIRGYRLNKEVIHPDFEILDEEDDELLHFKRIVPVYSEAEGLHQKWLRRIVRRALDDYSRFLLSPIPDTVCRKYNLGPLDEAVRRAHFPGDEEDIQACNRRESNAWRRLVFDEFFYFELGMALRKKRNRSEAGISFRTDGDLVRRFHDFLPYQLTGAQKRVAEEILKDMACPYPMNRLLQGDVGCGKTVVSVMAMLTACQNDYQAAMMAPTEILAEQHFRQIDWWAGRLGLRCVLVTGSQPRGERKRFLGMIETGEARLIVGTHALIQENTKFRKLGLAVIDEQHRFGVIQRAMLREKGLNPDVLYMTATPIPRTLALTVYGDLDISVIDEMPPGRKEIETRVLYDRDREQLYRIIRGEHRKGNQVFIVYPLIEESETLDLKDVTRMARHLQEKIFPDCRIGLMHGKMKRDERDRIMTEFKSGGMDILVSTTVIEVGIDIPQASLMIIEHAERFGLSQLHQLRGRVGRGEIPARCILMADYNQSETSARRLRIMEETNDGFRIAEEDLAIRGPGEFLGVRQSGFPDFTVADILRDARILSEARRESFAVVERDPLLEDEQNASLKKALLLRWGGPPFFLKGG